MYTSVPSIIDPRDYKLYVDSKTTPAKVDLSNYCIVKNQDKYNTSSVFSCIGSLELILSKFGDAKITQLSEAFTYYATRVDVLNGTQDTSSVSIRNVLKSLVKYGSCQSSSYEYTEDNLYKNKPNEDIYKEASQYQVLVYARFEDYKTGDDRKKQLTILKNNLALGFPIICGIACYSNFNENKNGKIPLKNGKFIGNHTILIVGYDDNTQSFKFKNSWGVDWGDNGYGYLPYMNYYMGCIYEMWSVYQTEYKDVVITDPMIKRKIYKTDLIDIFTDIINNIDLVINPKDLMTYFHVLRNKYKDFEHLSSMIQLLNLHISSISEKIIK